LGRADLHGSAAREVVVQSPLQDSGRSKPAVRGALSGGVGASMRKPIRHHLHARTAPLGSDFSSQLRSANGSVQPVPSDPRQRGHSWDLDITSSTDGSKPWRLKRRNVAPRLSPARDFMNLGQASRNHTNIVLHCSLTQLVYLTYDVYRE
jgi:hypothetical protein